MTYWLNLTFLLANISQALQTPLELHLLHPGLQTKGRLVILMSIFGKKYFSCSQYRRTAKDALHHSVLSHSMSRKVDKFESGWLLLNYPCTKSKLLPRNNQCKIYPWYSQQSLSRRGNWRLSRSRFGSSLNFFWFFWRIVFRFI